MQRSRVMRQVSMKERKTRVLQHTDLRNKSDSRRVCAEHGEIDGSSDIM